MDALPIDENTNCYSSKINGIMHARGQDIHTLIGLGVAKLIKTLDLNIEQELSFNPENRWC